MQVYRSMLTKLYSEQASSLDVNSCTWKLCNRQLVVCQRCLTGCAAVKTPLVPWNACHCWVSILDSCGHTLCAEYMVNRSLHS